MEFRRSGGRDERRRRVLMDDSIAADDTSAEGTSSAEAPPAENSRARNAPEYADAAESNRQMRLSDLMPLRPWVVTLLTMLAATMAAGFTALAWYAPQWNWLDLRARAIFSADAPGSLASWFASLIMLLCASGAMQIYLLRRHKINDYRGRYRVWTSMAAAFLLASANAIASLHWLLGLALAALLPAAWLPAPQFAWMLPLTIIVAGLGVRLTIEVRRSYGTVAALCLASVAYLVSGAVYWNPALAGASAGAQPHTAAVAVLASQLAGHVFVLLAVMVYGRYVHLAANGLLTVREAKPAAKRSRKKAAQPVAAGESNDTPETESRRSRAAKPAAAKAPAKVPAAKASPAEPAPEEKPASRSAAKPAPAKEAPSKSVVKERSTAAPATLSLDELAQYDDLDDEATSHLSKAERRRLKKLQRRSNRAA